MNEAQEDLWEFDCDVRCITTNGTITNAGANIMGGGCAREAAVRYPSLPLIYASMIQSHGHHVMPLYRGLVMFPTKERIDTPATVGVIVRSCWELMRLADVYDWTKIALPRPGCGLGGLNWTEVEPAISRILDWRVTVLDFPKETA